MIISMLRRSAGSLQAALSGSSHVHCLTAPRTLPRIVLSKALSGGKGLSDRTRAVLYRFTNDVYLLNT